MQRSRFPKRLTGKVNRRGLAPVELVLWLPILLMVMALIVNYASMASWRARGEFVSRDAGWRSRWPRSGNVEPRPPVSVWPANAGMGVRGDAAIPQLNHPFIQHPVVRGPILELGDPPSRFGVNGTLSQDPGARVGVSNITRPYPLLTRLGNFESGEIANRLLTRQWQCASMGFPNHYRRTLILYDLPQTNPSLPTAYVRSVLDLVGIPHYYALSVLDRDEDWRIARGGYPNFYPRIRANYGETDPAIVYDRSVRRMVDQIDGRGRVVMGQISRLPRSMTNAYLGMYRGVKREIEMLEAELVGTPPPTPARRMQITSRLSQLYQIQDLDQKIAQLEDDVRELDSREDAMKEAFRRSRLGA